MNVDLVSSVSRLFARMMDLKNPLHISEFMEEFLVAPTILPVRHVPEFWLWGMSNAFAKGDVTTGLYFIRHYFFAKGEEARGIIVARDIERLIYTL